MNPLNLRKDKRYEKKSLTDLFDNISYESAKEIIEKYEPSVKKLTEDRQFKVYNKVMVIIRESEINSKSGNNA